jgi:hypothetical protein
MASNNNKGKGKGGFGMSKRQRMEKAQLDCINRKKNLIGCEMKSKKMNEIKSRSYVLV